MGYDGDICTCDFTGGEFVKEMERMRRVIRNYFSLAPDMVDEGCDVIGMSLNLTDEDRQTIIDVLNGDI